MKRVRQGMDLPLLNRFLTAIVLVLGYSDFDPDEKDCG